MLTLGTLHLSKHTGAKHTATVIFFHGSGGHGVDMKEWVRIVLKNFTFPHIKVLYPTAPSQPYTPANRHYNNVWFDREDISIQAHEKLESISQVEPLIRKLIREENEAGIPSSRIIVGGFSMGGALALHTAYRWDCNLAGVFAFSSFLNNDSIVYKTIKSSSNTKFPPCLLIHGDNDDLIDIEWGRKTFKELKASGIQTEFHVMERLEHSINRRGLTIIKEWIEKLLPEA